MNENISFESIISEHLERMRARISENIEANGQRASGRTQKSLRWEASDTSGTLYGRSFFESLEHGRGPTRNGGDGTLWSVIRQWIIDKGIAVRIIPYKTDRPHKYTAEERSLNAMAYAITRRIHESGTRLYRDGGRSDVYTSVINEEKPLILRDLKKKMNENIVKFNQLK